VSFVTFVAHRRAQPGVKAWRPQLPLVATALM